MILWVVWLEPSVWQGAFIVERLRGLFMLDHVPMKEFLLADLLYLKVPNKENNY